MINPAVRRWLMGPALFKFKKKNCFFRPRFLYALRLHVLDHVSLCTPVPLNNMAPQLCAPCSAGQPPMPLSHISPSHPPLILIQPGMPFALYGLLVCSTSNPPPPLTPHTPPMYHKYTQNHISSVCCWSQWVKLSMVLELAAAGVS